MTQSIVGIILMACSYFIGCISPATIVAKANGIDIRKEGSGNPGTTNVLRTLGKKAAAVTLIIDILKGAVPVIIGAFAGPVFAFGCGTMAMIGHVRAVPQLPAPITPILFISHHLLFAEAEF